jgi:hypothetical protein
VQLTDLPLPRPDETLVRASEHLDRLNERAVARHRAVLMTIRAHQIGQHVSITSVALGAGGGVPVAVAAGRKRVDRVDRIGGLQQCRDPQTAIGLDRETCATSERSNGLVTNALSLTSVPSFAPAEMGACVRSERRFER